MTKEEWIQRYTAAFGPIAGHLVSPIIAARAYEDNFTQDPSEMGELDATPHFAISYQKNGILSGMTAPSAKLPGITISAIRPDYGNGAVAMLTEALDLAKKGEITQVAIVALCADGGYKHLVSNEQSVSTMTLLGALTALQFQILGRHHGDE